MLALDIALFIVSSIFLVVGARILVMSSTKVASYLGMKEFVIGFMVVAIGTSLPELFVGINAALSGNPILSLGDVLGANIMDLTVVIGSAALLARGISIKSELERRDVLYILILTLFPLLLALDQRLSQIDGVILLLAFSMYFLRLFGQRKEFRRTMDHVSRKEFRKNVLYLLVGILILLASTRFVVLFATSIAVEFSIPMLLVGIIMLGMGTTLPELVFETRAAMEGHLDMTLGDLFGSLVCNSTLVLGIVAIISPIEITNTLLFYVAAGFMFFTIILFTLFIRSREGLSWQGGIALVFLYIIFIIMELMIELGVLVGVV